MNALPGWEDLDLAETQYGRTVDGMGFNFGHEVQTQSVASNGNEELHWLNTAWSHQQQVEGV